MLFSILFELVLEIFKTTIDGDQKPSQKQRLKMQPLRHEGRIVHLRKYELLNRIVVVTAVVKLPDIETSVVSKDRLMPQASWNH